MTRQASFTVFVTPQGYHEAGWRVQGSDPASAIGLEGFAQTARTAERGLLDAVFLADRPALSTMRAQFFPQVWHDALTLLTAMGMAAPRIGLIGTLSTTYNAPYDVARRLATADHVTGGRIGWNVVTTHDVDAARNFGLPEHPPHEDRYARAGEFVDVVRRLWDSWDDDVVVGDRASGVWAATERITPAAHEGEWYSVAGALPVPRPPQGHPVLAQAGSSPPGVELAGRVADVVFTPQQTVEAGIAFRERLDAAAARAGRPAGSVRILPGIAFVLGSTEAEATALREELEGAVDPELRWRNLAPNAGIDPARLDPSQPLSDEVAATAGQSTFATVIVQQAMETRLPFRELAQRVTGLPGGLEFTGTPEQLADLVQDWVTRGGSDGFTLQPATIPRDLDAFVDHVVPLLQERGLHRREYTGTTLRDHLGLTRPPA